MNDFQEKLFFCKKDWKIEKQENLSQKAVFPFQLHQTKIQSCYCFVKKLPKRQGKTVSNNNFNFDGDFESEKKIFLSWKFPSAFRFRNFPLSWNFLLLCNPEGAKKKLVKRHFVIFITFDWKNFILGEIFQQILGKFSLWNETAREMQIFRL